MGTRQNDTTGTYSHMKRESGKEPVLRTTAYRTKDVARINAESSVSPAPAARGPHATT